MPDSSIASPGARTWAVRAHLEWAKAFRLGGGSVSPYAALSHARSKLDRYAESGGGFPSSFNARSEGNTEFRLGANGALPLNASVKLVGTLEQVHRFQKDGTVTSGQVIGLFGFSLPGQSYKTDWLRAGAGVESKLGGGVASVMVNGTTRGEASNVWLAASWRMPF